MEGVGGAGETGWWGAQGAARGVGQGWGTPHQEPILSTESVPNLCTKGLDKCGLGVYKATAHYVILGYLTSRSAEAVRVWAEEVENRRRQRRRLFVGVYSESLHRNSRGFRGGVWGFLPSFVQAAEEAVARPEQAEHIQFSQQ